MNNQDRELAGIVQDTAQVVTLFLGHYPGQGHWDRSYHAANCAAAFLSAVDEARFDQGQEELSPHVVTTPVRCWVQVRWDGQDYALDFLNGESVVNAADDLRYQEMLAMDWPEEEWSLALEKV
jgi:hypothetical protein